MTSHIRSNRTPGNRLSLDFANLPFTAGDPAPHAASWLELVEFLEEKCIMSGEKTERLRALPENDAVAAQTLMMQAERLANGMRFAFRAMIRGSRIHREWIEPINEILRVTEGHDELEWDGNVWRLEFLAKEEGLEWLLAAIARSGAELIAAGARGGLRECSNPNCHLLFYDDSRTHRRRWCSMALCGNRSKVAAFALRQNRLRVQAHHA
jgi:predicted RNA-binding Zn ribbon-like protein